MERIGITASKIAKGNLYQYNFYVLLISLLVSLLLFLLSATAVFAGIWLIRSICDWAFPLVDPSSWSMIYFGAGSVLTALVVLINIIAISKNIKFRK